MAQCPPKYAPVSITYFFVRVFDLFVDSEFNWGEVDVVFILG